MKRLVIFLFLIPLVFVSCDLSPKVQSTETQIKYTMTPTLGSLTETPASTDPTQVPTSTLTPSLTQTPTVAPQTTSTATIQNEKSLPDLLASQPITITHITMSDMSYGWAIGHQHDSGDRILYTQDGGYSWDERTPPLPDS